VYNTDLVAKDHEKETDKKLATLQNDKLVKDIGIKSAEVTMANADIRNRDTKISQQAQVIMGKDTDIAQREQQIKDSKETVSAAILKSFSVQGDMVNYLKGQGMSEQDAVKMFQSYNSQLIQNLGELYIPPQEQDNSDSSSKDPSKKV
jgi:hypothetical protein